MNASDRGQLLYRLADLIERDREYLAVSLATKCRLYACEMSASKCLN